MKTLASALGILMMAGLLAACGPDMKVINDATSKAEGDVTRAESAAKSAEDASTQAEAAAKKAEDAAAGAEDAVRRANDAASRLEAAFATSVTK